MNKQDLINLVTQSTDVGNKQTAEAVVNSVFAQIEVAVTSGEEVRITGFGTFKRMATQARTCRNPHTGAAIEVPAGHRVKFKASSKFGV